MLGAALVTLAGFSWLFVLPANIRGHVENPYIGLLMFIAIPMVFFSGLALIPIGIALARRRVAQQPDQPCRPADRLAPRRHFLRGDDGRERDHRQPAELSRGGANGDRAILRTKLPRDEARVHGASDRSPSGSEPARPATSRPAPPAGSKSKMAGTNQLMAVVFNTFPRPIESALESNRLVSSADTCEQCHAREMFIGPRLRVAASYKDDETNTRSETVLTMLVGGGRFGGIHGAHMGPGVHIRYAAQDKKRQTLPWVEYRNSTTGVTRTYLASGTTADSVRSLPTFEMQCVDCHNRAAHSFEAPGRAVDDAITTGQIAADLPFVKKTGVELIKAAYPTDDEAGQKIPAGLTAFYQQKYPDIAGKRASDIQAAGEALLAIYRRNVFPDLKVTWGTYPNNLGHTDDPGCFRCHDGSHATADNKTPSPRIAAPATSRWPWRRRRRRF